MDLAFALAALSGIGWATNIVVVRWALGRTSAPPMAGAFVAVAVGAAIALTLALASGSNPPDAGLLWRFALVGAIAPGSSQGFFVSAIGSIGPARSSVLVSTNPLWSVVLAILFLGEGWRVPVLAGTLLVVVGGVLISWEPGLGFKHRGVVLALLVAVTFGVRDVVASSVSSDNDLSIWWAIAIVLGSASVVVGTIGFTQLGFSFVAGVRQASKSFVWSGLASMFALTALFGALDRTEVGSVVPITNAFQSVAVVILGAAVFGKTERTPRILAALVLVVAGGSLIALA